MARVKAYEIESISRTRDLLLMGQSVDPAMSSLRARSGYYTFANRIETLRHAVPKPSGKAPVRMSREHTRFGEQVDALWRAASGEFDFAIARTANYLNWRYCDRRAGQFVVRVAEQGESMTGYVVLCTRGKRGYMADVLVLPGRADILRALLDDAQEYFTDAGVAQVECWTAELHPYRDALAASGFVRRKRHGEFGYLPLRTPHEGLTLLGGKNAVIHLMAGDVDWI